MRLHLALVVAAVAVAVPVPAAADVVEPAGACVAAATWKAGAFTRTSTQLSADDVIEVPRSDQVAWSGRVVGPAAGASREVAGRVAVRLPPPFAAIGVADWQGPSTQVERKGTYTYDLPSLVPSGVRFDLTAWHDEAGRRVCTANVGLIIPGGPFETPLIWVALVALLGLAALLALFGRGGGPGRIVLAALLGLPFGLFAGATLVLFGVLPLASPLVTVLLVLGPAAGALWAWWSPLPTKSAPVPGSGG
jgi:hypothetical protein